MDLRDALIIVGIGLIVGGISLMHVPSGLIALGLFAFFAGLPKGAE